MDGEKERRNLLVISTAVLLFCWLDLPDGMISERVLGKPVDGNVEVWRLWVAVIFLIAYQAHRFYSVTVGSVLFSEAKSIFRAWRREVVRGALREEMKNLSAGKQEMPVMFCGAFSRNELVEKSGDAVRVDWRVVVFENGSITHFDEYCWTGNHRLSLQTEHQNFMGGEEFSFPERKRILVDACLMPRLFKTKFLSEYGVPVVLAYAALWLGMHRLSGLLW